MFLQHQKRFIQWLRWEEEDEQPEEPDQRRDRNATTARARCEKARLLFVRVSLFILFVCFFYFFLTRNDIPLFLSIVVLFLGYRCFDAWLSSHEHQPSPSCLRKTPSPLSVLTRQRRAR